MSLSPHGGVRSSSSQFQQDRPSVHITNTATSAASKISTSPGNCLLQRQLNASSGDMTLLPTRGQ